LLGDSNVKYTNSKPDPTSSTVSPLAINNIAG